MMQRKQIETSVHVCMHARTRALAHTHTHFRVSQTSEMEDTFKRSELNFFTLQLGKIKSQRGPGTCPNDTVTGAELEL